MYYEIVPMDRSHIDQIAALERECFSTPWTEQMLSDALFDSQASFIVDEGYIDNIAVEPDARRHGVASALLDVYCRFGAVNLAFLTLEVRASNQAAMGLYEKYGFQRAGLRPGYYQHPKEDAVIMTRYFNEQEGEQP